jgi:enoyl-CoA hydratase/carnithine racemase
MTAARIDVRIERRESDTVAYVTVCNERKLNILDTALMNHFRAAIDDLAQQDDLRAVVLSGAGEKAFIGGVDIREMAALTPKSAEALITLVHRTCNSLRALPVPVIARIDGYALGGGLEVAAACDMRVASNRARFGMPEVKVGIPSVVEAALLPYLIGWGRTRELLLCGETIDAETAERWGLVEEVTAPEQLDAAVERRVTALLAAGPRAVRLQKALIREWEGLPPAAAIAVGIRCFVDSWTTDEPARLMQAFANRRRPSGP